MILTWGLSCNIWTWYPCSETVQHSTFSLFILTLLSSLTKDDTAQSQEELPGSRYKGYTSQVGKAWCYDSEPLELS